MTIVPNPRVDVFALALQRNAHPLPNPCGFPTPKHRCLATPIIITFSSCPITIIAVFTLAAGEGMRELLQPQADYFSTLGLPEPLVHWGHPGNMMVRAPTKCSMD